MWLIQTPGEAASPAPAGILEVAPDGTTPYRTIQQAIDAAPPGSTIRIAPGRYPENLRINRSVRLEGPGWAKATVGLFPQVAESDYHRLRRELEAKARSGADRAETRREYVERLMGFVPVALSISAGAEVHIRGLRFSQLPDSGTSFFTPPGAEAPLAPPYLVQATSATLHLDACALVGSGGSGLQVGEGAAADVTGCLVAAIWSDGITVNGTSQHPATASISNSDIRSCYHYGIAIGGRTRNVSVENCRISDTAWHGIRLDDCAPHVASNRILRHARCGMYVSGTTSATITNNLLQDCEMDGICFWFDSADLAEHNTFARNRTGAGMTDGAHPTLRFNIFTENREAVSWGHTRDFSGVATSATAQQSVGLNLIWNNAGGPEDLATTTNSLVAEPRFFDPSAYVLAADFETTAGRFGATELPPAESPFPLLPEERAMLPKDKTRTWTAWTKPQIAWKDPLTSGTGR